MSMLKGGEKFTIMSEIRMENVQWGKGWGGEGLKGETEYVKYIINKHSRDGL